MEEQRKSKGRAKEEYRRKENGVRNASTPLADAPGLCSPGDRQEAQDAFRITSFLCLSAWKSAG